MAASCRSCCVSCSPHKKRAEGIAIGNAKTFPINQSAGSSGAFFRPVVWRCRRSANARKYARHKRIRMLPGIERSHVRLAIAKPHGLSIRLYHFWPICLYCVEAVRTRRRLPHLTGTPGISCRFIESTTIRFLRFTLYSSCAASPNHPRTNYQATVSAWLRLRKEWPKPPVASKNGVGNAISMR